MRWAAPMRGVTLLLAAIALVGAGCDSYTIRARVIQSQRGSVTIEPLDAAPSNGPGVEGVTVKIHRDPSQLNRTVAAQAMTNSNGDAVLKVAGFGTGWMAEEWLVEAIGAGFERSEAVLALPGNPKDDVIIIRMVPGVSVPLERDTDPMDDYERYR